MFHNHKFELIRKIDNERESSRFCERAGKPFYVAMKLKHANQLLLLFINHCNHVFPRQLRIHGGEGVFFTLKMEAAWSSDTLVSYLPQHYTAS
jgi:hypothetical protein